MTDEMTTRPTIETVLERIGAFDTKLDNRINTLEQKIDALEQKFDERIDSLEQKFDERIDALERKVDQRFDQVDARFRHVDNELDRVSSVAHSTKAELATLRIAFREMREQVKEALPILQES